MRRVMTFLGLTTLFVVGCGSGSETASQDSGATPASDAGTTAPPKAEAPTGADAMVSPAGGTGYAAVQAVFTSKCAGCHGATHPKGGIDLTSFDSVMKGGKEGPVIVAGDGDSLLLKAIKGLPGARKMPPGAPLEDAQIKTIEDWVKAGAKNS